MIDKFKYPIFPDRKYSVTLDDWAGEPYTFDVVGEDIIAALRRDALLQRAFEDLTFEEESDTI